jgi:hypothetical protein
MPMDQVTTRKPFVKMQIEKVSLRTTETMGLYCNKLSSTSSLGRDQTCTTPTVACDTLIQY